MSLSANRLAAVDALRGVAALAVLAHHLPRIPAAAFSYDWWLGLPFEFGYLGVTLFLVLSGFCIHARVAKAIAAGGPAVADWPDFWRRRALRLYPAYVAAIVVAGLLNLDALRTASSSRTLADLTSHLTLSHNLTRDYGFGWFNAAFWSLGLEFQLYLLCPVYLALRRRHPVERVVLISAVVSVIWLLGTMGLTLIIYRVAGRPVAQQAIGPFGSWGIWPFGYWFAWVLGAAAAEYAAGASPAPARLVRGRTIVLGALACVLLNERTLWIAAKQPAIVGLPGGVLIKDLSRWIGTLADPAFAIVCAAIVVRWTRSGSNSRWLKPLTAAGLISYSLYLTHVPLIAALRRVWTGPPTIAMLLLVSAICIAFAAVFFCLIEWPCLRALERRRPTGEQKRSVRRAA
jgi:peptidoglycan/LPS O-acetylase OafA/YrhL